MRLQNRFMRRDTENAEETCRIFIWGKRLIHIFCDCFLIAVLFVFPLYYKDFYYDILPAKYQFYYMSVLALALAALATGLAMMIFDLKMFEGAEYKEILREFPPLKFEKKADCSGMVPDGLFGGSVDFHNPVGLYLRILLGK